MSNNFTGNTELFALDAIHILEEKMAKSPAPPSSSALNNGGSHEPSSNGLPPSPPTPTAQIPTAEHHASQIPAAQHPTSQIPASQIPTSQIPTSQIPPAQQQNLSPSRNMKPSTTQPSSLLMQSSSKSSGPPTPTASPPPSPPSLSPAPHGSDLSSPVISADMNTNQQHPSPSSTATFKGKIVYNLDGSVYIIDEISDGELELMEEEGIMVDYSSKIYPMTQPSFPQIAKSLYVQRRLFCNWLRTNHPLRAKVHEPCSKDPIMHSFRVYDFRSVGGKKDGKENKLDNSSSPVTSQTESDEEGTLPVLMCFICKLSFGKASALTYHATTEHSMDLLEEEKEIMQRKNSNAIIQGIGTNKEPLISFLEPVTPPSPPPPTQTPLATILKNAAPCKFHWCNRKVKIKEKEQVKENEYLYLPTQTPTNGATTQQPQSTPPPPQSPTSSASAADSQTSPHNLSDLQNNNINAQKDKTEGENGREHQKSIGFHTSSMTSSAGPGHESTSGHQEVNSPTSSPSSLSPRSPPTVSSSSSPPSISTPYQYDSSDRTALTMTSTPVAPMPPIQGIVIRAGCENHPNGNITGEECTKCERILGQPPHPNQLMHSRNSCKTLKCPKCNWHYKYQETLENHMKDKHPENDAQCLYCMTSQPHPRLARGEVYTCGYKPYRCEVCNYSTTTKGNLSIHMQSDKHINNMQELQNQAQGGGGGGGGGGTAGTDVGRTGVPDRMLQFKTQQGDTAAGSSMSQAAVASAVVASGSMRGVTSSPSSPPQNYRQGGESEENSMQRRTTNNTSTTVGPPGVGDSMVESPGSRGASGSGSSLGSAVSNKTKPSWRCDVCSYETNVARNLRIHMTSEKHTHNMMVLDQNVKHMQRDVHLHMSQQMAMMDPATARAMMDAMSGGPGGLMSGPGMNPGGPGAQMPPQSQAAAAVALQQQFAAFAAAGFDPTTAAMLMGGPGGGGMLPPGFPPGAGMPGMEGLAAAAQAMNADHQAKAMEQLQLQLQQQMNQTMIPMMNQKLNQQQNPQQQFHPPQLQLQNGIHGGSERGEPNQLYQCAVCEVFNTDSVDAMHAHMQLDRTKSGNEDHVQNVSGINMCQLCQYKTNLKANFQLHCKTDKHLQRLQLVNHIREGGPHVEWHLKYMANISNPVQVRCNPCDYYTNSIHKLQLHTTNPSHDASSKLFAHLRASEVQLQMKNKSSSSSPPKISCYYHCQVCSHNSRTKQALLGHVRSMKHCQHERVRIRQLQEAGRQHEYIMEKIFFVRTIHKDEEAEVRFDDDEDNTTNAIDDDQDDERDQTKNEEKDTAMQLTTSSTSNSSAPGETPIVCPYCNYSSVHETRINEHIKKQHLQDGNRSNSSERGHVLHGRSIPTSAAPDSSSTSRNMAAVHVNTSKLRTVLKCPLCQEKHREKSSLEQHIIQVHNATPENVPGLMKMTVLEEYKLEEDEEEESQEQDEYKKSAVGDLSKSLSDPSHSHSYNSQTDEVTELIESQALKMAEEAEKEGLYISDSEDNLSTSKNTSLQHRNKSSADNENLLRCHVCTELFPNLDALFVHHNESGHLDLKQTPKGGYLCWKKGCNQYFEVASKLQEHFRQIHMYSAAPKPQKDESSQHVSISEKHAFCYRCKHCPMAFKEMDKLNLHTNYHLIRDAANCNVCGRSFRTIDSMAKHVNEAHKGAMTQEQENRFRQNLAVVSQLKERFQRPASVKGFPVSTEGLAQGPKTGSATSALSGNGERMDEEKMEVDDTDTSLAATGNAGESALEYEDPNCKYKCLRCKVAFTSIKLLKQHNNTEMHRQGNSTTRYDSGPIMSTASSTFVTSSTPVSTATPATPQEYTSDKYHDPSRPFKCDICKESFTQKNILLSHQNSVNHMARVKKQLQEQDEDSASTSLTASPHPQAASTPKAAAPKKNPAQPEEKNFKCNICHVSYSQSRELENHKQSTQHQSRAGKLPELVQSGEVDILRPLMEPMSEVDAHAQHYMLQQMIAAISHSGAGFPALSYMYPMPIVSSAAHAMSMFGMNSYSVAGSASPVLSSATLPSLSSTSISTSKVNTETAIEPSTLPSTPASTATSTPSSTPAPLVCTKCNTGFQSQEELVVHQQMHCYIPMRNKPQVQRNLLENIGFDTVMQYNEYAQKIQKKIVPEEEGREEEEKDDNDIADTDKEEPEKKKANQCVKSEYEKCPCDTCGKEFSSIWVLKAHQEEVHKQVVPVGYVENIGKSVKEELEKKYSTYSPAEQDMPPPNEVPTTTDVKTESTAPTSPKKGNATKDTNQTNQGNVQEATFIAKAAKATAEAKAAEAKATASQLPPGMTPELAQQMMMQMQMPMFGMMPGMPFGMPGMNMMPMMGMSSMPADFMGFPMGFPPGMMEMPQMPGMHTNSIPGVTSQSTAVQQAQPTQLSAPSPQAAAAAAALVLNQAKRPRTRINDDQLKILRGYFDANSSPGDPEIHKMSEQTGLPAKVIKHWFRNTLFKERQRNKDSIYNFNIPPQTELDTEEYEKTGQTRLRESDKFNAEQAAAQEAAQAAVLAQQGHLRDPEENQNTVSPVTSVSQDKTGKPKPQTPTQAPTTKATSTPNPVKIEPKEDQEDVESMTSSVGDSFFSSAPSTPAAHTPAPVVSMPMLQGMSLPSPANMVASHADINAALAHMLSHPESNNPPPPPPPMIPISSSMTNENSYYHSNSMYSNASQNNMSSASSHMSKRANRTRFTDYQLRVLQEYFEQNAYPKDDELDLLSKQLGLSPRVIVVWFQNARQKARKNYENNPPMGLQDEEERFSRTPGLNYQCKRCSQVFQRYYELIRHQKTQCYKDEPNHPSISYPNSTAEDSNSSSYTNSFNVGASVNYNHNDKETSRSDTHKKSDVFSSPSTVTSAKASSTFQQAPVSSVQTPLVSNSPHQTIVIKPEIPGEEERKDKEDTMFNCEICDSKFARFDMWKEHMNLHNLAPNLFSQLPPESAFAMLQSVGAQASLSSKKTYQTNQIQTSTPVPTSSARNESPFSSMMDNFGSMHRSSSPATSSNQSGYDFSSPHNPLKRKAGEEEVVTTDALGQKRMRTTIMPEQLDYLYQQYSEECNPSRKQIELFASSIGLTKRVVQVWFQNTRARERKGQGRAHNQIIHKRCPVCRALFRAKSALESHLATKHPERMAKGDINIDSLPDEPLDSLSMSSPPPLSPSPNSVSAGGLPLDMARLMNPFNMHPGMAAMPNFPGMMLGQHGPSASQMQHQMNQMNIMCEDNFKKYLEDLSAASSNGQPQPQKGMQPPAPTQSKSPAVSSSGNSNHGDQDEAPLDLSKQKLKSCDDNVLNMSTDSIRRISMDDTNSDAYSESAESHNDDGGIMTDYYPSSPNTKALNYSTNTPTTSSAGNSPHNSQMPHKRYRTQMNSLQIKVMKAMFVDYKTPTMAECELLGREIGLAKRVVQVWFQNARAKEKKAKLNYSNNYNMEVDFYRAPEECKVCNFTYSHKYTIQDHIFTKNHIARLRSSMMAQGDSGTESSYPEFKDPIVVRPALSAAAAAAAAGGGEGGMRECSNTSASTPGKSSWGGNSEATASVATHPHLAQLHALGLNAMASDSKRKEPNNSHNRNDNDKKAASKSKSPATPSMYGGPDSLPSFMMPPLMPPLMPPPSHGMPGGSDMMMYDPVLFGTPLQMLQIPSAAIQSIQSKLATAGCLITRYTQDCQDLPSDLSSHVRNTMVDVGFICRKCHMVFPQRSACVTHQQTYCFIGEQSKNSTGNIIKLEQIQYECSRNCKETQVLSTVAEVEAHIQDEEHQRHQAKVHTSSTQAATATDVVSPSTNTPGESAPSSPNPTL